ncbi:MAG TPA: hypothetical protein VFF65_08815, partial [Phycisphaerales bacterium]|nr:hypothetical protein [Phycisphaerales bacterium]
MRTLFTVVAAPAFAGVLAAPVAGQMVILQRTTSLLAAAHGLGSDVETGGTTDLLPFNATVSASVPRGGGVARQTSSVSPSVISWNLSVGCATSHGSPMQGTVTTSGGGESSLEVLFRVDSPATYTLTGLQYWIPGVSTMTLQRTGPGGPVTLAQVPGFSGDADYSLSGQLTPGDYRLWVALSLGGGDGFAGDAGCNGTLTVVPA